MTSKESFPASPCNVCGVYNKPQYQEEYNGDIKYFYRCQCNNVYKRSHNSMLAFRRICSKVAKEYWMSLKHKENGSEDVYSSTEKILKSILDELGIKYCHNFVIPTLRDGKIRRYVADFYLPDFNVDIEGDSYIFHNLWGVKEKDKLRDEALFKVHGIKVIRYTDKELTKPEEVKRDIVSQLGIVFKEEG